MQENAAENDPSGARSLRTLQEMTPQHLSLLLGRTTGIWRVFGSRGREEEDEDDDDEEYLYGTYRRSPQWFPPVTEPQQAGLDLLMSGEFGRVGRKTTSRHKQQLNLAKLIHNPTIRFNAAAYIEDITSVRTLL